MFFVKRKCSLGLKFSVMYATTVERRITCIVSSLQSDSEVNPCAPPVLNVSMIQRQIYVNLVLNVSVIRRKVHVIL